MNSLSFLILSVFGSLLYVAVKAMQYFDTITGYMP